LTSIEAPVLDEVRICQKCDEGLKQFVSMGLPKMLWKDFKAMVAATPMPCTEDQIDETAADLIARCEFLKLSSEDTRRAALALYRTFGMIQKET
jgi:hypothetical protein